jgi:hypothetical protein
MAASTGYILAAGAIVAANEAIFAPAASGKTVLTGVDFNWRIVPATALAALTLAGLEQVSEPLAKGLAIIALLTVLAVPVGNAPTPIDNLNKYLRMNK